MGSGLGGRICGWGLVLMEWTVEFGREDWARTKVRAWPRFWRCWDQLVLGLGIRFFFFFFLLQETGDFDEGIGNLGFRVLDVDL